MYEKRLDSSAVSEHLFVILKIVSWERGHTEQRSIIWQILYTRYDYAITAPFVSKTSKRNHILNATTPRSIIVTNDRFVMVFPPVLSVNRDSHLCMSESSSSACSYLVYLCTLLLSCFLRHCHFSALLFRYVCPMVGRNVHCAAFGSYVLTQESYFGTFSSLIKPFHVISILSD